MSPHKSQNEPRPSTPSIYQRAKKLAAWAAIATTIVAFGIQGYTVIGAIREKAKHDQETADRIGALETISAETHKDVKDLTVAVGRIEGKLDERNARSAHALTIAPDYGARP